MIDITSYDSGVMYVEFPEFDAGLRVYVDELSVELDVHRDRMRLVC